MRMFDIMRIQRNKILCKHCFPMYAYEDTDLNIWMTKYKAIYINDYIIKMCAAWMMKCCNTRLTTLF